MAKLKTLRIAWNHLGGGNMYYDIVLTGKLGRYAFWYDGNYETDLKSGSISREKLQFFEQARPQWAKYVSFSLNGSGALRASITADIWKTNDLKNLRRQLEIISDTYDDLSAILMDCFNIDTESRAEYVIGIMDERLDEDI